MPYLRMTKMSELTVIRHQDGGCAISAHSRVLRLSPADTRRLIEELARPMIAAEVSRLLGVEY